MVKIQHFLEAEKLLLSLLGDIAASSGCTRGRAAVTERARPPTRSSRFCSNLASPKATTLPTPTAMSGTLLCQRRTQPRVSGISTRLFPRRSCIMSPSATKYITLIDFYAIEGDRSSSFTDSMTRYRVLTRRNASNRSSTDPTATTTESASLPCPAFIYLRIAVLSPFDRLCLFFLVVSFT